jgi:hypothetical protein
MSFVTSVTQIAGIFAWRLLDGSKWITTASIVGLGPVRVDREAVIALHGFAIAQSLGIFRPEVAVLKQECSLARRELQGAQVLVFVAEFIHAFPDLARSQCREVPRRGQRHESIAHIVEHVRQIGQRVHLIDLVALNDAAIDARRA